jgi:biotin carboxyl carrier protein
MRYFVTVNGRTYEVELGGSQAVRVDGRALSAELRAVPGTPVKHLLLDGRSYTLIATRANGAGWALHLDGQRLEVEAVDERTRAIREMTGHSAPARGPKPVRAPMPGLVVRIEVEAGQHVQPGQGVAVIEAMKMENELRADGAGVVARVLVAAGQAVEKGAVLVEFEEG